MNISLNQLEVFKSLSEKKSFTVAAKDHGISQSAVSQQITSLEREFRTLLLEDKYKKPLLTRAGLRFYEFAKDMVQSYGAMRTDLAEIEKGNSGTIRISAADTIDLYWLQANIERFNDDYPLVQFRLEQRQPELITRDIKDNYADFGIVADSGSRGFDTMPYSEDNLVIICHPRHTLAGQAEVSFASVAYETFVGLTRDHPTQKLVGTLFSGIKSAMEFDQIETLQCAVELAEGIAIVPEATVNQGRDRSCLAVVRIKGSPRCRHTLIYQKGRRLPRAMVPFIEMSFPARQQKRNERMPEETMNAAPRIALA